MRKSRLILTLILVFLSAPLSARDYAKAAPNLEVVLELTRSLPAFREVIVLRYKDGVEQILLNSNHLMPSKKETGLYQRRSSLLFSKVKVQGSVNVANIDETGKPKPPIMIPHGWNVTLMGKAIPQDDPRVAELLKAVEDETKDFSKWTALETVQVKPGLPEVEFKYFKNSKVMKTEKASFSKVCNVNSGKGVACKTQYGYVTL